MTASQSCFLAILAEADESFAKTGDVMEALGWVAFAATAGTALPPRIGSWLQAAIGAYTSGSQKTLDGALGLKNASNPRRRKRELNEKQSQLSRMLVLHMLGATIPQAAAMARRLSPVLSVSTLIDQYTRSGLGPRAKESAQLAQRTYRAAEISALLAEYPDGGEHKVEVALGKRAILNMYAKHHQ